MTSTPLIQIVPNGNTGNRMIQHILALGIQSHVPSARIVGTHLPEWNISVPYEETDAPVRRLVGHRVKFRTALKRLISGDIGGVRISTPCSRMEYLERYIKLARRAFRMKPVPNMDLSDKLVIHVRLNKMDKLRQGQASLGHRDYPALPIAYYEQLVDETHLEPLFVGEFGEDPVSVALKKRFPAASFIRQPDAMKDWRLIYSAETVAISPSTFSWLASWLSPYSRTIYLPMAGFLNPEQRPDIDLLPIRDPRFKFYDFPVEHWTASPDQIGRVVDGPGSKGQLTNEQVAERLQQADVRSAEMQAARAGDIDTPALAEEGESR
ncbi:hypothetical protein [Sphingomonas sp. ID0503]|uniref:hypothetical protein n=1 Tax=Sphingomonas sp. ID0503 TaxID=3399691 RepID=UPI003AFA4B85